MLAVLLTIVLSYAFGGKEYIGSLSGYSTTLAHHSSATQHWVAVVLELVTTGAVLVALIYRRFSSGLLWVFPTGISPVGLPWYTSLSFPYGFGLGSAFAAFLAALPLTTVLLDPNYITSFTSEFASTLAATLVCAILALDYRVSTAVAACNNGRRRALLAGVKKPPIAGP